MKCREKNSRRCTDSLRASLTQLRASGTRRRICFAAAVTETKRLFGAWGEGAKKLLGQRDRARTKAGVTRSSELVACFIESRFEPLEARRLLAIDLSGVGTWESAGPRGINDGQNQADYDSNGLTHP